jgi:hypothetical protein
MTMNRKEINEILWRLDQAANRVASLGEKIDPETSMHIQKNLDMCADRIEVAAFGKSSFENRKAKVLKRDTDEPYMETFQNPQKPIKTDADEPYMHETGPSFNGKSVPTYDSDDTSQVIDRDEYDVRDRSEWADPTKQQPSWTKGSAGKSTRQGSDKDWAP